MPVRVSKRAETFRVVEAKSGKIAKNAAGTPLDGGGHKMRAPATRQARAVNANKRKS